jgi:hypothetical protein
MVWMSRKTIYGRAFRIFMIVLIAIKGTAIIFTGTAESYHVHLVVGIICISMAAFFACLEIYRNSICRKSK